MINGNLSVEWARKFFTDAKYSPSVAISIYANHDNDLPDDARYYLGVAAREYTQGEG